MENLLKVHTICCKYHLGDAEKSAERASVSLVFLQMHQISIDSHSLRTHVKIDSVRCEFPIRTILDHSRQKLFENYFKLCGPLPKGRPTQPEIPGLSDDQKRSRRAANASTGDDPQAEMGPNAQELRQNV